MTDLSILPILGFMGLSFLELGRGTRETDRQTDRYRGPIYNAPSLRGGGIKTAKPDGLYYSVLKAYRVVQKTGPAYCKYSENSMTKSHGNW